MKYPALLFLFFSTVFSSISLLAQKSLSFQIGAQTAYDITKLDDRYIADPNLTFPAGTSETRMHVHNPVGIQAYATWNLGKNLALQSGFEMVKRKITYYDAFASNSPCVICDVDVDMPLYSVPLNLIIRLNPNTDPGNWAVSFKAGFSGQWSGKTDNVFRFGGSTSLETPNKVSVEEVSEGQYRMFLVVDEEFGIGGQYGLALTKDMGKLGSIGIEAGFKNQFFNTTSIQIWGYDKAADSRINGYNPYSFKFASLYLGVNYGLPWKIGGKA